MLFTVLIIYLLAVLTRDWQPPQNIPYIRNFSVRWLAVIPVVMLLEILRRYNNDLYIFGLEKVTKEQGRLSLSYSVPVVKYMDIRSVTVVQDIWGRIFNYGNVELSTAARTGAELVLEAVGDPEALAVFLEDCRSHVKRMGLDGRSRHENTD